MSLENWDGGWVVVVGLSANKKVETQKLCLFHVEKKNMQIYDIY